MIIKPQTELGERMAADLALLHAQLLEDLAKEIEETNSPLTAAQTLRICAEEIRKTVERHLPGRRVQ